MADRTAQTPRSKNRVYEDLKRRILALDLEPGAHLDEMRLSSDYGVSRTPLRDLLRQLAGEGYVKIEENRGAQVSPMSHKTMRDFFQTAPMIYASVGRLAAENRTPAALDRLKEAQRCFSLAAAAECTDDLTFWNDHFHFIIGEMADNVFLIPSYRRLLIDHARIGRTFWRFATPQARADVETAAAQHDEFIALIEAGAAEAVVALTLAHWALSRAHLESYVRPDPLPIDGGVAGA